MAKKKFREEKYIKNRLSKRTGLWSFQVAFEYIDLYEEKQNYTKTFAEKNYPTAGAALDAACAHRDKKRNELNTIGYLEVKKYYLTVEQVYERSKEIFKLRKKTYIKKDKRFKKYIKPFCGSKKMNQVNELDIYLTLNSMSSTSSDDTINCVFTVWKDIYRTARILKEVQTNITEEIICPKSEVIPQKKKEVTTNMATIQKVFDALRKRTRKSDEHTFNTEIIIFAIQIMYYTGLRPAECFALNRDDVSFVKNCFRIDEEIGSSSDDLNVLRRTKTELSTREMPISKELKEVLINLMSFQDNYFLLADWKGNLFDINTVTNKICRCCKLEGIEFNMYRCRHQFSADLITQKEDPRTVMELMGHNNIRMTVDYARSSQDLKEKALNGRKLS